MIRVDAEIIRAQVFVHEILLPVFWGSPVLIPKSFQKLRCTGVPGVQLLDLFPGVQLIDYAVQFASKVSPGFLLQIKKSTELVKPALCCHAAQVAPQTPWTFHLGASRGLFHVGIRHDTMGFQEKKTQCT